MAHGTECPPNPGRTRRADGVVDDNQIVIADAKGTDFGRKLVRRGQHVGQVGVFVGDFINFEEARACDVALRRIPPWRPALWSASGGCRPR